MANRCSSLAVLVLLLQFSVISGEIIRDYCGPGWDVPYKTSHSCYKFVYDRLITYNWYSARFYCEQHDSKLLVLENEDEAQWLRDVLMEKEGMTGVHGVDFEAVAWYVGAHKQLYCKDQPCWSDGRPINAPVVFNDIHDSGLYLDCMKKEFAYLPACYAIDFDDQETFGIKALDANCSANYRDVGFICEKAATAAPSEPPRLCTYEEAKDAPCSDGWLQPNSPMTAAPYCYKFVHPTEISWDGAYRQCRHEQAELLYVENAHEARWIKSKLSELMPIGNAMQRYAINMHYFMHDYGTWSFSNHVRREHSGFEWENGQPDFSCSAEYCSELWSPHDKFTLNDIPCSTVGLQLGYICKKPACYMRHKANVTVARTSKIRTEF